MVQFPELAASHSQQKFLTVFVTVVSEPERTAERLPSDLQHFPLTSINGFFSCTKPDIININPSLGDEIDFFSKNKFSKISFCCTFRLSHTERDRLYHDIAEERPQVRNLLDQIGGLRITVRTVAVAALMTKEALSPEIQHFIEGLG